MLDLEPLVKEIVRVEMAKEFAKRDRLTVQTSSEVPSRHGQKWERVEQETVIMGLNALVSAMSISLSRTHIAIKAKLLAALQGGI